MESTQVSLPRSALDRMADALEKLASDPEIEIEMGPPLCPECGKLNPIIELAPTPEGERGPMLELVVEARCMNCESRLFIAIESFSVHTSFQTVRAEIEGRRAGF